MRLLVLASCVAVTVACASDPTMMPAPVDAARTDNAGDDRPPPDVPGDTGRDDAPDAIVASDVASIPDADALSSDVPERLDVSDDRPDAPDDVPSDTAVPDRADPRDVSPLDVSLAPDIASPMDTPTPGSDVPTDNGTADTATMDAGTMDAGTMDTGTMDTGTMDVGAADTAPPPDDGPPADADAAPRICTPGTTECVGAERVRTCAAGGERWDERACGASSSCAMGACRPWVCTPGSMTCASGTATSVCNVDGLGRSTVPCPMGTTCIDNRCTAWVCTPNTRICRGTSSYARCRDDGLGYTSSLDCVAPTNAVLPTCTAGQCTYSCSPGYGDCDMGAANGCEVDIRSNLQHCGRCGQACAPPPNMAASCVSGSCRYACNAGFGDCDRLVANGCEADFVADASNCGGCGTTCTLQGTVGECRGGRCVATGCQAGLADCNRTLSDGCEVTLLRSELNCGACGRVCPPTTAPNTAPACADGVCGSRCATGFGDCDGNPANGCETSTSSDPRNCLTCGRVCDYGGACEGGRCTLRSAPPLTVRRYGSAAAALDDNRVFVFGGEGEGSTSLSSYEGYDPATNRWTRGSAALPLPLYGAAAVALPDGRILLVGGRNGTAASAAVWAFSPATGAFTTRRSMSTGRIRHAAVLGRDGRVYVFGGRAYTPEFALASSEVYDPATDTWSSIRSPRVSRVGAVALRVADGRIYLHGGTTRDPSPGSLASEIYDPATDTWTSGPAGSGLQLTDAAGAVNRTGNMLLVGGDTGAGISESLLSCSFDGVCTLAGRGPRPRTLFPFVALRDGRILAIGGLGLNSIGDATPLTAVDTYIGGAPAWY